LSVTLPRDATPLLIQKSDGRLREPQAQAILAAARTPVGLLRRQRALSLKLELLAQAIIVLNTQVQRVEDTIEELFRLDDMRASERSHFYWLRYPDIGLLTVIVAIP